MVVCIHGRNHSILLYFVFVAVVWGGANKNREIVEPSSWEDYSVPLWGWLLIAIPLVGGFVLCIVLLLWAICKRKDT